MRLEHFEHVLAAAAEVTGEENLVVIGSQAILGSVSAPPAVLLVSMEVDIYPMAVPEDAIKIDGAVGDGSPFHSTFGYYAHGVGPTTAKAPSGWQERLVRREIPMRVGINSCERSLGRLIESARQAITGLWRLRAARLPSRC